MKTERTARLLSFSSEPGRHSATSRTIMGIGHSYGNPFYPLSHLGLGRAYALIGDLPKARKSYENFFTIWKDADPGIPILVQAKKEYAKTSSKLSIDSHARAV